MAHLPTMSGSMDEGFLDENTDNSILLHKTHDSGYHSVGPNQTLPIYSNFEENLDSFDAISGLGFQAEAGAFEFQRASAHTEPALSRPSIHGQNPAQNNTIFRPELHIGFSALLPVRHMRPPPPQGKGR